MGFLIEPLSDQTFERALDLIVRSFPDDEPDGMRTALRSSLEREDQNLKAWLQSKGCRTVNYWIATEGIQVVGITGLYAKLEDEAEAYWLAWFCVDITRRRQGLGRRLIEHSMEMSLAGGRRYLRLYTTTAPNEAAAQVFYWKLGFVTTHSEPDPGTPYNLLHKELDLLAWKSWV